MLFCIPSSNIQIFRLLCLASLGVESNVHFSHSAVCGCVHFPLRRWCWTSFRVLNASPVSSLVKRLSQYPHRFLPRSPVSRGSASVLCRWPYGPLIFKVIYVNTFYPSHSFPTFRSPSEVFHTFAELLKHNLRHILKWEYLSKNPLESGKCQTRSS